MSLAERIWWLLTFGSVTWYSTITIYIAVRGFTDIRKMLDRLASQNSE
jgi:hypothetical protein